ncbi:hypothetical protein THAOC_37250, partial [Thalassiosira oceanica]
VARAGGDGGNRRGGRDVPARPTYVEHAGRPRGGRTAGPPQDRPVRHQGGHMPRVPHEAGVEEEQLRELRGPVRAVPLRDMQPLDVERRAPVPLSRLRFLQGRRGGELHTLSRLRDVHRQAPLRRTQLQGREVHVQLPRVPGGPLLVPRRVPRAPVRTRHTLALLPPARGARLAVSDMQEDGRDARQDEADLGRHGHGHRTPARAPGALQGRDHKVLRLRERPGGPRVALPRRPVRRLRELQHGRRADREGRAGGARAPPAGGGGRGPAAPAVRRATPRCRPRQGSARGVNVSPPSSGGAVRRPRRRRATVATDGNALRQAPPPPFGS